MFTFFTTLAGQSQLVVADFESYSLSPNSFYFDTLNTPFSSQNASFNHRSDNFGSWYWTGGFAYTNVLDSSDGSSANLYGIKAYKGYNNSNNFVIGQDQGLIQLASVQNTVEGFYITNTTFAYKTMWYGDSFSRKFGDTTGTGSGTTIAQGAYPDFFKVTVKAYKSGLMKADSVEYYLADYRNPNPNLDYIVDTWQWVNTSSLGEADSLRFFMYSSDVGQFGINTPLYFAIDNFTTKGEIIGIKENSARETLTVFPNPCQDQLFINSSVDFESIPYEIYSNSGTLVDFGTLTNAKPVLELKNLSSGIYLLELKHNSGSEHKRFIKE